MGCGGLTRESPLSVINTLTAHLTHKLDQKGQHRRKQRKERRYGLPCMDWVTGLQFWTLLISILIPFEATPPLSFHEISSQESGESEYYEFMHELAKLTQRLILTRFLLIVLRNVVDNESLVWTNSIYSMKDNNKSNVPSVPLKRQYSSKSCLLYDFGHWCAPIWIIWTQAITSEIIWNIKWISKESCKIKQWQFYINWICFSCHLSISKVIFSTSNASNHPTKYSDNWLLSQSKQKNSTCRKSSEKNNTFWISYVTHKTPSPTFPPL